MKTIMAFASLLKKPANIMIDITDYVAIVNSFRAQCFLRTGGGPPGVLFCKSLFFSSFFGFLKFIFEPH